MKSIQQFATLKETTPLSVAEFIVSRLIKEKCIGKYKNFPRIFIKIKNKHEILKIY